ncbi:MAG TPA: DUF1501 domain-containing protein, partial [Verrucomicrobiae bacterium]|nr:DUF1501 domain-containing protein [Verrucomicrobiae bacterium]
MSAQYRFSQEFIRNHFPDAESLCTTRRQFLARFGLGVGALGLATMVAEDLILPGAAAAPVEGPPLASRQPHFPARARHVVHIFAQGAPSQVDTWDPKPELSKRDGKAIPGVNGLAYGSPFKFKRRGKSGIEVSEVFNRLG